MEANGLSDHVIQVGQELIIPLEQGGPSPTPESGETPEAETTTYVVQAGDSLTEIAERFNVSLQAIMEANDIIDADSIRQGQKLVIPGATTSTETPGVGGAPTPTASSQLVYPSPTLLGPAPEKEFREEQAELAILLNWLSVGLLGEDEWYCVTVRFLDAEGEEQEIVEYAKANSYRLSSELRPPSDAESHAFEWEVRVVRLIETDREDGPQVMPIGSRSELRSFYWY